MSKFFNRVNLKAPGNWINDPNGFIYYGGKYHLFYQYFPYGPFWGTMHWGHAVSDDLVNWEHLGTALFPTKEYDRNGVFSGSALEVDGKMYLYYTGVVYEGENPENIHLASGEKARQCQVLLISEDGFKFDNFHAKQQIIPVMTDTDIADPSDCRDPKVWKLGDTYYMCLASTHGKEKGVLLLFQSKDAVRWTYLNRLESDRLGYILECPDLVEVDGKWLLVSCPMGISEEGISYPHHAVIQPVTFEPESGEIQFEGEGRYLDYGFDLYASQSNIDEDGRRVFVAWIRMQTPMKAISNPASDGKEWNGMMTIPRTLELRNGEIVTAPHPNIRKYFMSKRCLSVSDGKTTMRCDERNCQIITTIAEGQWIDISGYRVGMENGRIVGDRTGLVPDGIEIHKRSETPYVGESCELEIYMDADLIEIFVDGGKYVLSHVTYRNASL